MSNSSLLSFRLKPELLSKLEYISSMTERSKSFLANKALERYIETEAEIIEGIKEAQMQVKEGKVHSHANVMQTMNEKLENFKNR